MGATIEQLQRHIDNLCPPEDEMPRYAAAILAEMNETRARYGFAPIGNDRLIEVVEERACDTIAELWVRKGSGLPEWRERLPEMVRLFDGDIEYRRGRIDLCDIVDTWADDFGLSGDDFERLNGSIRGWTVSHMAAYGRTGR